MDHRLTGPRNDLIWTLPFEPVVCLDRTSDIANAYLEVWPKITLLNCYPHCNRKSRENRARLLKREFYETNVELNIFSIDSLTDDQALFKDTGAHRMRVGTRIGWSRHTWAIWGNWFYTAAISGLTPSQNALESHHKVIKKTYMNSLRASTSVVLNDALPRILKHQEQQSVMFQLLHYCESPLIGTEVEHAQKLLLNQKNYYSDKAPNAKVLTGILFKAVKFMVSSTVPFPNTQDTVWELELPQRPRCIDLNAKAIVIPNWYALACHQAVQGEHPVA
ncbi:LOW QUALITY PROTEIN: hypothetical protein PHMEG_00027530 [Phytophthora megakarya]|uniref:MULE transposase domain-containing protein n=1 Tax=Phytophthora megakarya TaxID=4795 RepID=A0A225V5G2_9STRA|nr:LOW QUALITY PROTEIN: hypothetical protein PHMEG_00027530 [Phytophthora megakarya]